MPAIGAQARERVRGGIRCGGMSIHAEFERSLPRRFLEVALITGDERVLLELIAPGAVLYGDGGGKAPSVVNPLYGHDRIVRFLMGLRRTFPGNSKCAQRGVNGQPGLLVYRDGVLSGVSTFEFLEGQIHGIFHVVNPDKLTVPRQE